MEKTFGIKKANQPRYRYEKESASIEPVDLISGGKALRVSMIISAGKFIAMCNALEKHNSEVGKDLLAMLKVYQ